MDSNIKMIMYMNRFLIIFCGFLVLGGCADLISVMLNNMQRPQILQNTPQINVYFDWINHVIVSLILSVLVILWNVVASGMPQQVRILVDIVLAICMLVPPAMDEFLFRQWKATGAGMDADGRFFLDAGLYVYGGLVGFSLYMILIAHQVVLTAFPKDD